MGGPENLQRSTIMCPANLKMRRFVTAYLFPKKNVDISADMMSNAMSTSENYKYDDFMQVEITF